MMTTTFEKEIQYDHGDFKMTLDGRFVGHRSTYSQAEHTLDEMVYEMLIHGDCATAEELDGDSAEPDPPPPPPALPLPTTPSELGDTEGDDEDPGEWRCACGAEATMFPLGALALCYDCAFATTSAGAVTLQSIQIERTIRTNRVCSNCQGAHVTWQCPSIARRLFALEGAA